MGDNPPSPAVPDPMPFLELSLRCRAADESWLEQALNDVGALAVTLMDAVAATPNERAVLEPGVGEQPLWAECVVTALFPAGTPQDGLLAALESIDPRVALETAEFRDVEDQDWERAWMDQYAPMQFGARTWIVPWNHALPEDADTLQAAVVRLDPGLAFGSGTHPTTALCLAWLDGLDLSGKTVLDVGCGSGILALAALKLGAASAVGIDNDPQALAASADNAQRNGVGDRLALHRPEDAPAAAYPVVVANILASALDALAETLAARVQPGGVIALSGILQGQETALLDRSAAWFDDLRVATLEDWVRIDGRRRA
jgi:ribosomal protein L11 methyltransferase